MTDDLTLWTQFNIKCFAQSMHKGLTSTLKSIRYCGTHRLWFEICSIHATKNIILFLSQSNTFIFSLLHIRQPHWKTRSVRSRVFSKQQNTRFPISPTPLHISWYNNSTALSHRLLSSY